jgi:hypothetical protein
MISHAAAFLSSKVHLSLVSALQLTILKLQCMLYPTCHVACHVAAPLSLPKKPKNVIDMAITHLYQNLAPPKNTTVPVVKESSVAAQHLPKTKT